jgi:F-type H+-transporting ATPase subunit a
MGEHGNWFDLLNRFSWWHGIQHKADALLGRKWTFLMFGEQHHVSLTHVLTALLVIGFVIVGGWSFFRGTRGDKGLVPPRKMTFRHFFEVVTEGIYGVVEGAMGEDNAPKYFPIIAGLWFFILFGNLIGLVPGFITPDDTIQTNLALAGLVFFLTHYYGVREHGLAYFKHFLGPVWWLIPLMLPLELISHCVRPFSLTIRLLGNMVADHMVLLAMFTLVPFLVPLPFYLLGMLVCVVQALVFCGLATAYFTMAVAHEDH